jgi:hypothetical protein
MISQSQKSITSSLCIWRIIVNNRLKHIWHRTNGIAFHDEYYYFYDIEGPWL